MTTILTELTMSLLSDDEELAIKIWEELRGEFNTRRLGYYGESKVKYSIGGCYTYFQNNFFSQNESRRYYFSFQAMPLWTYDLLEEFNNLFTNIKIIPVKSAPVYLHSRTSYWGNKQFEMSTKRYSEKDDELVQILFTIEHSKDYNKNTLTYLYYILHHLIRMISLGENRVKYERPLGSLLEHIFSLSLHNKYRSLCEFKLSIEDFKKLDDIERVNFYLNWTNFLTQTEIFMNLLWDKFCQFPKKERVLVSNNYRGTVVGFTPEKINKYGGAFGYSDSGNSCSHLRVNFIPDKMIPTNIGKFKIDDFVTTKVNYSGILKGRVKELYEHNYMLMEDLSTKKEIQANQLVYKRIPKTRYRYYGIEG